MTLLTTCAPVYVTRERLTQLPPLRAGAKTGSNRRGGLSARQCKNDMARSGDSETTRLDDAARAGWLYYMAGNTQDEIARKLGISRQSAQRLVTLAVTERLIKMRLDHPIGRCQELAAGLRQAFGLGFCEIAPSDPESPSSTLGIAELAAVEMERWLRSPEPIIMGLGTGRTLRATADQLPRMECPQHKLVSRLGTIKADGSATFYDVIIKISDTIRAPHYPMPLPVFARTAAERALLTSLESVRNVVSLAEKADVTFVGIGHLGEKSPFLEDGVISLAEVEGLRALGAVGEITGWAFDSNGQVVEHQTNARVTSVQFGPPGQNHVIGVAMGAARRGAMLAALRGKLVTGLVTDEMTAEYLLGQ